MNAVTTNTTIDLTLLGLLHIAGVDAKKFLQGQITCDLNQISATQSLLGAHCNPQGRILSLFRLFSFHENYYLQMPAALIPSAIDAFKKYAVFFKVTLQDASSSFHRAGFTGDGLQKIFPLLPELADTTAPEDNLLIIRLAGDEPRYELLGDKNAIDDIAIQLQSKALTDPLNTWKYWNITAGIPGLYESTIGKFLPHEINLQLLNGVSFEKGCYTGQEIIARMHYRGQLKKRMYQARATASVCPLPGSDIYEEGPAGIVVDSCFDSKDSVLMLVICDDQSVKTKQLFLDPGKTQPLEFNPLSLGNDHV
ncbi:MAG: folate-binding protein [Gammaproteobacteria bacterium]|nr:folate-binding protein [Gammaproteobacteria bacterium]